MNKLDILYRKITIAYDEQKLCTGIVPTEDEFNELALKVRQNTTFEYTDAEFSDVRDRVRERYAARIGLVQTIDKKAVDHDLEWFSKYKEEHQGELYYNDRFKEYMLEEKHWTESMINELERNTDIIVNRLGDPKKAGPWKRKGLVIGDIQSGKTVNYTSICNKAIDAGYKIIIILAGRTNTLRRQTQKRIETDLIGFRKDDTNKKKGEVIPSIKVGVSYYGKTPPYNVSAVTTNVTDFSKQVADSHATLIYDQMQPIVFVVKKIKSVLDNLAQWMSGEDRKIIDVPLLLIDDEADDASINTKSVDNPTAINSGIRQILKLFSRSTYLAVTATPFANILINPYIEGTEEIDKDLFPEDFISCLPTPSEYIGSERMFRGDDDSFIVPIMDSDVAEAFPFGHKKTQDIESLPDILKEAIRYYVITNVVRDILGHTGTHRSMMINISRFVDVQNRLKSRVLDFWEDRILLYTKAFSKMGEHALEYEEICEIKQVFEKYQFAEKFKEHGITWDLVQESLYESNKDVKVMSINQKSSDSLDYEKYEKENNDGLRVIAIGGNCLSRGLTLEGLCVSFFYRNSKMYDTLMQMGRWFGYREGYAGLVKVWLAEDAVSWYTHISEATEQLKLDVYRMNRSNLTPMDFGYKIMGHPDSLIPSARVKTKAARVKMEPVYVDLSGCLVESPRLINRKDTLKANEKLVKSFLDHLGNGTRRKNGDLVFTNVRADEVATLIRNFKSKVWRFYYEGKSLAEGIENNNEKWTVVVKNGKEKGYGFEAKGLSFGAQKRKSLWDDDVIKVSGSKVKVGAGESVSAGLPDTISQKDVEKEWRKLPDDFCKKEDKSDYKDIPDEFYLHGFITDPVLLIHILRIVDKSGEDLFARNECPVIALGLGFPSDESYIDSKRNKKRKMMVKVYLNTIAQQLEDEEGDDVVDENL